MEKEKKRGRVHVCVYMHVYMCVPVCLCSHKPVRMCKGLNWMQIHCNSTIKTNTVTFPANLQSVRLPLPEHQPAEERGGVDQAVAGGLHSRRGAQHPRGPAWTPELACPGSDVPPLPLPGTATVVDMAEQRCLSWDTTNSLTQECSWPLSALLWTCFVHWDWRPSLSGDGSDGTCVSGVAGGTRVSNRLGHFWTETWVCSRSSGWTIRLPSSPCPKAFLVSLSVLTF